MNAGTHTHPCTHTINHGIQLINQVKTLTNSNLNVMRKNM